MSSGILKPIVKEQSKHVVKFETRRRKTPAQLDNKEAGFKSKKFSRNEKDAENKDGDDKNVKREEHLSLKQAKFDVFKYGIKGFDKKKQEDAKIELAVKLGARVSHIFKFVFLY
jgi:hypothetical protein